MGTDVASGRLDADGLRIRSAEPSDYEAISASMNAPRALAGTLQLPFTSNDHWRRRLAESTAGSVLLVSEVRERPADAWQVVGSAGLDPVVSSMRRRHVAVLGMAIRDDWQGRGIGTALMTALVDRADNWMNVLRIELMVFADNVAARRMYERVGFVVEGTHRAHALREGIYVDSLSMARLHPRPPALPPMAS